MITRFVIYPYKISSESAHRLKDYLKSIGKSAIIVYPDRAYQCQSGDVVVGWGNSKEPKWKNTLHKAKYVFNPWAAVENSIDKSKTFELLKSFGSIVDNTLNTPPHTIYHNTAKKWLESGKFVIGRKILRGMRGRGIVVMKSPNEFEECKLYTQFIPNNKEFRIYVFRDKIIDVLEKRRKQGTNDRGFVRSEENNWVFCRQNVILTSECKKQAILACKALGLTFAGVDVIYDAGTKKAFVLETNTCPEIFGTGVKIFAEELIKYAV